MKLYLSSYRLGDNPDALVNLVRNNKKVAVIANAMDFLTDEAGRKESAEMEIRDLEILGFEPEEVDLRKYFGKPDELREKLAEYGLVWVRGGNVFVLRMAFKESGMDEWLLNQRMNKELVYGGYSAGVCVLSPDLKGLEIVDNPNTIAECYSKDIEWKGLGIINFAFAPHYMSNHPEAEAVSRLVEYYVKNGIEYKALKDGQVIIEEVA